MSLHLSRAISMTRNPVDRARSTMKWSRTATLRPRASASAARSAAVWSRLSTSSLERSLPGSRTQLHLLMLLHVPSFSLRKGSKWMRRMNLLPRSWLGAKVCCDRVWALQEDIGAAS